jgi:WD40 repeat protein
VSVLTGVPAAAQTWSSDSRKVVFGGSPLLQVDIRSLVPEPKSTAPLPAEVVGTGLPGAGTWPVPSPDGGKISFISQGGKLTILDTVSQQSITPEASAISPAAWSPDSDFLAVVLADDAGGLKLKSLHANGEMALTVSLPFTKLGTGLSLPIAWVPTTDNVIIAGGDGTKTDLYLVDQGQVVPLTTTGDVLGFGVSDDGAKVRWIMKSRNTHHILFSIYEMQIAKRTLTKVSFPDRLASVNPVPNKSVDAVVSAAFSPNLNQIAFITRGGPGADANTSALFVTDSRGGRTLSLARTSPPAAAPRPAAGPKDDGAPPAPPALPAPLGTVVPGSGAQALEASAPAGPFGLASFSLDNRKLSYIRTVGDKRYLFVVRLDTDERLVGLLP